MLKSLFFALCFLQKVLKSHALQVLSSALAFQESCILQPLISLISEFSIFATTLSNSFKAFSRSISLILIILIDLSILNFSDSSGTFKSSSQFSINSISFLYSFSFLGISVRLVCKSC